MEKGSFHSSRPSSPSSPSSSPLKEIEDVVRNIPLPNQLPKEIDFKELPVSSLKSSTLEHLIDQNDDLMARLAVSLRKQHALEEKTTTLEGEAQNLRARFETLRDQFLVLQQKDQRASGRAAELQEENIDLKQHISKLEKMYADTYVQAQSFQRRLRHLERYRARLKKVLPGVRDQLLQVKHLRETIKDLNGHEAQLTQSYEVKLAEARDQIESMRERAAERDRLFEEKIQVENRLVFEKRQFDLSRKDTAMRLEKLATENSSLRIELKSALLDRESKTADLVQRNEEVQCLREERVQLGQQVESLQALWSHKQRETEHLEEKYQNLQKLNQSISAGLNQQRKEIHGLSTDLEQERFRSAEKEKLLLHEIQMLRESLKSLPPKAEA